MRSSPGPGDRPTRLWPRRRGPPDPAARVCPRMTLGLRFTVVSWLWSGVGNAIPRATTAAATARRRTATHDAGPPQRRQLAQFERYYDSLSVPPSPKSPTATSASGRLLWIASTPGLPYRTSGTQAQSLDTLPNAADSTWSVLRALFCFSSTAAAAASKRCSSRFEGANCFPAPADSASRNSATNWNWTPPMAHPRRRT